MKKSLFALSALVLSASAFADAAPVAGFANPMEPIVDCRPAHLMMDTGYSLRILHQRIGSSEEAVFTQFFLGRSNTTEFRNISFSEKERHGEVETQTFTAPVRNGEFRLEIDMSRRDEQGNSPATLEIGAEKYDLACHHLMMAL